MTVATLEKTTHPFDLAREAGREPFKVADLRLAEHGRKEIRLAEHEMPGLMAVRKKYGAEKPLAGTLEHAREMTEAAEAAGITTMVASGSLALT